MRTSGKMRLKKSLILAAIFGTGVALVFPLVDDMPWNPAYIPATFLIGFVPVITVLFIDIFVISKYFKRMHGILYVLLSTVINLTLITAMLLLVIITMNLSPDYHSGESDVLEVLTHPDTQISIWSIGVTILLIQMYSLLNSFLGKGMLFRLFFGVYHRPREEEKIFMFLDVKSSTAIAEKIGHLKFLSLLQEFYYDLSEAVAASRGEIYKYVGDEAIIIWKMKKAGQNDDTVKCFFELKKIISQKEAFYLKKFGTVPGFKAAAHCGRVVIGEIGIEKKEISYLGDVINTTARIEEVCSRSGKDFLISKDTLDHMQIKDPYHAVSIGEVTLRGKDLPLTLFEVQVQ